VSVDGKMTDTHPGETDDNHNLEQISSSVSELTQEEEGLVAIMEEIIPATHNWCQHCTIKMCMVLSPNTDTKRTTASINFHDNESISTSIRY
jgi:hypothetical protein